LDNFFVFLTIHAIVFTIESCAVTGGLLFVCASNVAAACCLLQQQQLQRGAALLCSLHWTWLNA